MVGNSFLDSPTPLSFSAENTPVQTPIYSQNYTSSDDNQPNKDSSLRTHADTLSFLDLADSCSGCTPLIKSPARIDDSNQDSDSNLPLDSPCKPLPLRYSIIPDIQAGTENKKEPYCYTTRFTRSTTHKSGFKTKPRSTLKYSSRSVNDSDAWELNTESGKISTRLRSAHRPLEMCADTLALNKAVKKNSGMNKLKTQKTKHRDKRTFNKVFKPEFDIDKNDNSLKVENEELEDQSEERNTKFEPLCNSIGSAKLDLSFSNETCLDSTPCLTDSNCVLTPTREASKPDLFMNSTNIVLKHDLDSSSHLEPTGIQKLELVYDLHSLENTNWQQLGHKQNRFDFDYDPSGNADISTNIHTLSKTKNRPCFFLKDDIYLPKRIGNCVDAVEDSLDHGVDLKHNGRIIMDPVTSDDLKKLRQADSNYDGVFLGDLKSNEYACVVKQYPHLISSSDKSLLLNEDTEYNFSPNESIYNQNSLIFPVEPFIPCAWMDYKLENNEQYSNLYFSSIEAVETNLYPKYALVKYLETTKKTSLDSFGLNNCNLANNGAVFEIRQYESISPDIYWNTTNAYI